MGFSRSYLMKLIIRKALRRRPEWASLQPSTRSSGQRLQDFLFVTLPDPLDPDALFDELRWGGQVVVISPHGSEVLAAEKKIRDAGTFVIDQPPTFVRRGLFGLPLAFPSHKIHYLIARKNALIKVGQSTDRFTYHVKLVPQKLADPPMAADASDQYVVEKQVPSLERVFGRLREKFPDVDADTLRRRARKFTDKIFPVFLTRELALLKLLQRDLPPQFAARVPTVIDAEYHDYAGTSLVRTLRLKWLRIGRRTPLSQLDFAQQSAELLAAIHDNAGIIHLDLRLDNFVITENGVGFVDFGSAVRQGEHFTDASLLSTLFEEMMRTSQIQKMLGSMSTKGLVTSHSITSCHQKVDKAVDFFYLAVQMNAPHSNPDFVDLVTYDPRSDEARRLKALTDEILRPSDPEHPTFNSAREILAGIQQIRRDMARETTPAQAASISV